MGHLRCNTLILVRCFSKSFSKVGENHGGSFSSNHRARISLTSPPMSLDRKCVSCFAFSHCHTCTQLHIDVLTSNITGIAPLRQWQHRLRDWPEEAPPNAFASDLHINPSRSSLSYYQDRCRTRQVGMQNLQANRMPRSRRRRSRLECQWA